MMDRLLEGCRSFSNAYINDLIIFSDMWEEHLHHLKAILDRIQKAELTVKKKQFNIGAKQVNYLVTL